MGIMFLHGTLPTRGRETHNWTRAEPLCLIPVWGEGRFQKWFEQMVDNHFVWEAMFQVVCLQYSTVKVAFGDFGVRRKRNT